MPARSRGLLVVGLAGLALTPGAHEAVAGGDHPLIAGPGCKERHLTSRGAQERAMLCLLRRARRRAAMPPVRRARELQRAARAKAADVVRCGIWVENPHTACGRPYNAWARRLAGTGYVGENIARGRLAATHVTMSGWMGSSAHRRNFLSRRWRHVGMARYLTGRSVVWVAILGR